MKESFKSKFHRFIFNFFPAYRRTGGRITFISDDHSEVKVKIPLNWKTKNYVGSIFGGSLYGAIDPIYMVMLINRLGPQFIVWDKSAEIKFMKPGRSTLYANFIIDDTEINMIKDKLEKQSSVDRKFRCVLLDKSGLVHATVDKTIYIRKKDSA